MDVFEGHGMLGLEHDLRRDLPCDNATKNAAAHVGIVAARFSSFSSSLRAACAPAGHELRLGATGGTVCDRLAAIEWYVRSRELLLSGPFPSDPDLTALTWQPFTEQRARPNPPRCAPGCRRRCRRLSNSYHSSRCGAPKRSDSEASASRSLLRRAGERTRAPQLQAPLQPNRRAIPLQPSDSAAARDREPHECRRAEREDPRPLHHAQARPWNSRTRSRSSVLRQAGSYCSWKCALASAIGAGPRVLVADGGKQGARECFRLLYGRNSIPRGHALSFQRALETPPVGRNLPLFLAVDPS